MTAVTERGEGDARRAAPAAVAPGSARMDPLIGQSLEKYQILEKIGEGGMATVYRGRHRTLDREVAIKVLHPHLSGNARNRERFSREARAIESLDHDCILKIFDYSGPDSDRCFIITEFIHGRTLKRALDDLGAFPGEVAAQVALDLATAVAIAHRRGIVHRDIKPENVMIDPRGRVKLMDFGIARFLDEAHVTVTGGLVGSPAYMSPEQATEREVDGRTDVYALGTLMYQLVTGRMPFQGTSAAAVLHAIVRGEHDPVQDVRPDLDPRLSRVIEKCMRRDPDDRYPRAESLGEALADALTGCGLDPDDREGRFGTLAFLSAPDAYRERLRRHLVPVLIARGKTLVGTDRTAEGMAILNRVLELDPDNAEVPAVIARAGKVRPTARGLLSRPFVAAVALSFLAVAVALAGWWIAGRTAAGGPGPEAAARTAVVEPPVPAPRVAAASPPTVQPRPTVQPPADPSDAPSEASRSAPATGAAAPSLQPGPAPAGASDGRARLRSYRPAGTPPPGRAPAAGKPEPPPAPAPVVVALQSAPPGPVPAAEEAIPAGTGLLRVQSANETLAVYLDGQHQGSITQWRRGVRVATGRHVVGVKGPFVSDWSTDVAVWPDREVTVRPDPRPLPARLRFQVPDQVEVRVDGTRIGRGRELRGKAHPVSPDEAHTVEFFDAEGVLVDQVRIEAIGAAEVRDLRCCGA